MLDSSTTASFLIPHIACLDSAIVFTNNFETAIQAIQHGINTHCIGGVSINGSVALGGVTTCKVLSEINVDILFFSSQSLDRSGIISDTTEEENYARQIMLEHAKTTVFLCTILYKIVRTEQKVMEKPMRVINCPSFTALE